MAYTIVCFVFLELWWRATGDRLCCMNMTGMKSGYIMITHKRMGRPGLETGETGGVGRVPEKKGGRGGTTVMGSSCMIWGTDGKTG